MLAVLMPPAPPAATEVVEALADEGEARLEAAETAAEAPDADTIDLMLETADVGTGIAVLPPGQVGHET